MDDVVSLFLLWAAVGAIVCGVLVSVRKGREERPSGRFVLAIVLFGGPLIWGAAIAALIYVIRNHGGPNG